MVCMHLLRDYLCLHILNLGIACLPGADGNSTMVGLFFKARVKATAARRKGGGIFYHGKEVSGTVLTGVLAGGGVSGFVDRC